MHKRPLLALALLLVCVCSQALSTHCGKLLPGDVQISVLRFASERNEIGSMEMQLNEILSIQRQHIVGRDEATPPQGFLIAKWDFQEAKELLKKGYALMARVRGELVGYCFVVQGSVFVNYFRPATDSFKHIENADGQLPDFHQLPYLYQVAVKKDWERQNVGTLLVEKAKERSPDGLFVGILEFPHNNVASFDLFSNAGFRQIAVLVAEGYRSFGSKSSRILLWDRSSAAE